MTNYPWRLFLADCLAVQNGMEDPSVVAFYSAIENPNFTDKEIEEIFSLLFYQPFADE